MTHQETARAWLPFVQAVADGKTLQHEGRNGWEDACGSICSVMYFFALNKVRIKPELKRRPWNDAERRQHLIDATVIQIADKIGPLSEQCGVPNICGLCFSWEAVFENGTVYETGAPCGVLE
jgi:hypothetical protein